jgi:hypothetical protein
MRDGYIYLITEIVIHLGINPVRGGRPLNDIRIIGIMNLYIGWDDMSLFMLFELVILDMCINKNKGEMIIEYII